MSANQTSERPNKAIELAEEDDFTLGKLGVRPSCRQIVAGDNTQTIEPRVMQALVALARRNGDVVSREQLIESCWGGRFVSEDALNRCMTKLRKLAAPDAFALETIPRVGYRLVVCQDPAPEPQPVSPSPAQPRISSAPATTRKQAGIPLRRWLPWTIAAALAVLLSMGFGAMQFLEQMTRPYFAVLPFEVVGADPRAASLATSISSAIANQLTTQGYELVSPVVAAKYTGERKAAAASELKVRYLIDGSVHVDRDRIRVSARIDAAGRVSVWSQEFDIDAAESSAAPDHVAMTISGLFNPGVRMVFDNPPQVTAAIMRVGARMRAGDDLGAFIATSELMRKSPTIRLYAIYHALAVSAVLDELPASERLRALQDGRGVSNFVKEGTSGAPMSIFVLSPPVEWSRRESVLREGLKQPFSDASGLRRLLTGHLANAGRLAEALAISEQALSIDRSSSSNITVNAYLLDGMGRTADADAVISRAKRLWPGLEFVERARFSVALARQDAVAMHALLADPASGRVLDPPADAHPLPAIARAFETRASADIDRVETECADPAKIARERARFCLHALVLLDRIDTFFALAPVYFPEQRGASAEERDTRWLADPRVLSNVRVLFRSDTSKVRSDERFIPIVERLGLLDYWRASGVWPDFCNSESGSVCAQLQAK